MKYLVTGSAGPVFASPEEAVAALETGSLPTFEALMKLEAERKILTGGIPVADRAVVFILEASSNEEADQLLRNLPAWGVLTWKVTPSRALKGGLLRSAISWQNSRKRGNSAFHFSLSASSHVA